MFTLLALSDVLPARSGRSETKEAWSLKRSCGPDRRGRCLDDCYGNRDHSEAFNTESHRWNGVKVLRRGREGRSEYKQEKRGETTARLFGEGKAESSRGLNAASLNINFCQRT